MACQKHPVKKDKSCLECFLDEIAAISKLLAGHEPPNLKDALFSLSGYFKELGKNEVATAAIATLNFEILVAQKKEGRGWDKLDPINLGKVSGKGGIDLVQAPLDPQDITNEHRQAYQRLVRRRGVWVGFAELHALGRLFGVRFTVYYAATGRDVELGDPLGLQIPQHCLVFTGNHYEVSRTAYRANAANRIAVNGLGDCALESFITMCALYGLQGVDQTQRNLIRGYRTILNRNDGWGLVPTDDDYWQIVDGLRTYLADNMNQGELDHAIVALGGRFMPKKDSKGKKDELEIVFDFVYDLKTLQKGLPWGETKCTLQTKKVGKGQYFAIEPSEVEGVCVLGGNCTVKKGIWGEALAFFAKMKGAKGVESDVPSLFLHKVDKKELAWLDTEGRNHLNDNQLPTHIGVCLVNVTTGKGTFAFLCAALNMECGRNANAVASTCYMGQGNGLHSEKYQMGLTQLVLAGFGIPFDDSLLSGHYFGTVTGAPIVKDPGILSVELIFANIACPCGTCHGFYANFVKSLTKAGIKKITAYAYYFLDHAQDWK
jgi:hypothetical protein